MSAPFLRFGALFKDNAFFNDTLKLKILNDRKRVGTSGTLVPLVPPAGNRTTASVCDQSEGMRSNRRSPKGKVFWVKNIFFTIKIPLQFKIFDFKVFKQTSFVRSAPLVALRGAPREAKLFKQTKFKIFDFKGFQGRWLSGLRRLFWKQL